MNTQLTARSYVCNLGPHTSQSGKRTINTVDLLKYTIALKADHILHKIKRSKLIKKIRPEKDEDMSYFSYLEKEDQLHLKYYRHQAPGSKVMFKWQNGEQKIYDAYNDKFKRVVNAFCEKYNNEILDIITQAENKNLRDMLTNEDINADSILKIMSLFDDILSPEANKDLKHILEFGKRVISSKSKSEVISTRKRIDDQYAQQVNITATIRDMLAPLDSVISALKKNDELSDFVGTAERLRKMLEWKSNNKLINEKNNAYNEQVTKSLTELLTAVQNMDLDTIQKNAKLFNHDVMKGGFFRKNRFTGSKFASNIKGIILAVKDAKRYGGNPLVMFGNAVRISKSAMGYQAGIDQRTKTALEDFNKALTTVVDKKPKK